MEERTFIASSELFSDFQCNVSLYSVSSLNDIIEAFTNELKTTLKKNNFTNLVKKLDDRNFHIHGYSIEDILVSEKESIFYVCDHI
tara:strand:- start:1191 stop:1448 length:258 start_codon:yes stop_codon:yes gene_type:complete